MFNTRMSGAILLAALLTLGVSACDDDDDGGLFTAPTAGPGPGDGGGGGAGFDLDCRDDTDPPIHRSLSAAPDQLWPPNHELVRVQLTARADDDCGPLDFRIVKVTSNQRVHGHGDGDTSPDWKIVGPLTVLLRAERSGKHHKREYTIHVRFSDGANNSAMERINVVVPHDQGGKGHDH